MSDRSQAREQRRSAPVACSLNQSDLAERQDRWHELAWRAVIEAVTTSSGLRLRFRAQPGVEAELRELAESERDCCAFAEWSVQARGSEVVLDVTAESEEGMPAVQAMFASVLKYWGREGSGSDAGSATAPDDDCAPGPA
jgi:hypothetical protein